MTSVDLKVWALFLTVPALLFVVAVCSARAFASSRWLIWYNGLVKSRHSPPIHISLSVWTFFHVVMGWAVVHAMQSGPVRIIFNEGFYCFAPYVIQLALGYLRTVIYFGTKKVGAWYIIGILHWLSVSLMFSFFVNYDPFAAVIGALYLVWVSFELYFIRYMYKYRDEYRYHLPKVVMYHQTSS